MSNKQLKPLEGILVLEQVPNQMAIVGKMLAEFGARVVRLEPPEGHIDRYDDIKSKKSIQFQIYNAGKESVVLNYDDSELEAKKEQLLEKANVLIYDPDYSFPLSVDIDAFREKYPKLVIISMSPFGVISDHAHWKGSNAVYSALCGQTSRSGFGSLDPLTPPGDVITWSAATQALFAVLSSLYTSLQNGKGRYIDFSMLEGAYYNLDPGFGLCGHDDIEMSPEVLPRKRPTFDVFPSYHCQDGIVRFGITTPNQWKGFLNLIGNPEKYQDPKYDDPKVRICDKKLQKFAKEFFKDKLKAEVLEQATQNNVPSAAIKNLKEAIDNEQVKACNVFSEHKIGQNFSIFMPNGAVTVNGERLSVGKIAPKLNEHHDLKEQNVVTAKVSDHQAIDMAQPLKGLKVLDMGIVFYGAETSRLLADLGADVVKIENATHPDVTRLWGRMSKPFHEGHRNKRSLGINLRTEEGIKIFLELAKQADIIVSNFAPGSLDRMGLNYDTVKKVNPNIIMVDGSSFGPYGPWAKRKGYGPLVRTETGLTSLWRYDNMLGDILTAYPDHSAARLGAAAVVGLLIKRLFSHTGAQASIAQSEVVLNHISVPIAQFCSELPTDPDDVPDGLFPTKGFDEWLAVSVKNDYEFSILAKLLHHQEWMGDPRFNTRDQRVEHREEIEAVFKAWLEEQTPDEAMFILQEKGIAAGKMLRVQDLPVNDEFVQREVFRYDTNPYIDDPMLSEKAPFTAYPPVVPNLRPAPLFGENTIEVMQDWLGFDKAKAEELIAKGILEIEKQ